MIKVTILYPNAPGRRFDHEYYETVHIPMSIELLGSAVRSVCVERGLSVGPPWPEPTYSAICSFVCESKEAYERALFPHLARLQGDLVNYSDVEALVQISEITIDFGSSLSRRPTRG